MSAAADTDSQCLPLQMYPLYLLLQILIIWSANADTDSLCPLLQIPVVHACCCRY